MWVSVIYIIIIIIVSMIVADVLLISVDLVIVGNFIIAVRPIVHNRCTANTVHGSVGVGA